MTDITISCVENTANLRRVCDLCASVLGEQYANIEIYTFAAWAQRLSECSSVMQYAEADGAVVAAVLCRRESADSLVLGAVCCAESFRKQGVTSRLLAAVEANAAKCGYKYITLGSASDAEPFYEKRGYKNIFEIHGQKIYQKLLN